MHTYHLDLKQKLKVEIATFKYVSFLEKTLKFDTQNSFRKIDSEQSLEIHPKDQLRKTF